MKVVVVVVVVEVARTDHRSYYRSLNVGSLESSSFSFS